MWCDVFIIKSNYFMCQKRDWDVTKEDLNKAENDFWSLLFTKYNTPILSIFVRQPSVVCSSSCGWKKWFWNWIDMLECCQRSNHCLEKVGSIQICCTYLIGTKQDHGEFCGGLDSSQWPKIFTNTSFYSIVTNF